MKHLQKIVALVLALISLRATVYSQSLCGFDIIKNHQTLASSKIKKSIIEADAKWSEYISNPPKTAHRITINASGDTIYEIPVVIHVMNTGGSIGTMYNPDDATLSGWIDYLNEVYAGTYPGYPQVGSGGVQLPVKFVLAKRDPNCNPTTGIERINMSSNNAYVLHGLNADNTNGVSDNDLTSISQWPINAYYNLYVVNKIDSKDGTGFGSYIAGYAYLGMSSPLFADDGAYMLATVATAGNITLPHEIGHALGLYHTFEGSSGSTCPSNTDCTSDGDKVCDTKPGIALLGTCPSDATTNPCTGTAYGVNGVHHNIMNYSQCVDHFTSGQADRMMYMLLNYRNSLINSNGAVSITTNVLPIAATCIPGSINTPGNYNIGPNDVMFDSIQSFSDGYTTSDPNFYIDHTTQCAIPTHTTLSIGDTAILSVSTNTNPQYVKAFIDYNNNGSFEPTENIMNTTANAGANPDTSTVNVVIPTTATINTPLRMRILADYTNINPCDNLDYGQMEDFSVTILPSTGLAIGIATFSGKAVGISKVLLQWKIAATTTPNTLFEIQRSIDGKEFVTVSVISGIANTQEYTAYDIINDKSEYYYYRLKIVQPDDVQYSNIIKVQIKDKNLEAINVYPNPTNKLINITTPIPVSSIQIINSLGKKITPINIISGNEKNIQLNVEQLPNGIYMLQLQIINGIIIHQKFIKE